MQLCWEPGLGGHSHPPSLCFNLSLSLQTVSLLWFISSCSSYSVCLSIQRQLLHLINIPQCNCWSLTNQDIPSCIVLPLWESQNISTTKQFKEFLYKNKKSFIHKQKHSDTIKSIRLNQEKTSQRKVSHTNETISWSLSLSVSLTSLNLDQSQRWSLVSCGYAVTHIQPIINQSRVAY